MVVLVVFILLAIATGLVAALGAAPFALVPGLLAVAVLVWAGIMLAKGKTPARAVRETPKAELLGPGGPDDPEAAR